MKRRKEGNALLSRGEKIFNVGNVILMCILFIIVFYPLWYIIMFSFSDPVEAVKKGVTFYPQKFTLYNYNIMFRTSQIFISFGVSFLRTIIGTVTSVFFTAMVAYGLSKRRLLGRKIFLGIGIVTLVFYAGMIPSYYVIKSLGLLDNFLVYIIPGLFSFYNALIFISFFRGIPESIEESAQIDGANDFTIFLKLILPLSMPVLATIALFNGVGAYNDYMTSLLYIRSKKLYTIQYTLYQIILNTSAKGLTKNMPASLRAAQQVSPYSLQFAAMVITSLPIVFVYPFLQKYFVKGVMIGSVKG